MHRLAPEAIDDLDKIAISIVEHGASLATASRIITAITGRFHLLATYPNLGRDRSADWGEGRRSYVAEGYVIVYRVDGEDVSILRVVHGKRNIRSLIE